MGRTIHLAVLAAVALLAAGAVQAQYDRDGRYVPSPGGVPADPYARPIPTYPGTPGGAIGTPVWPRGPDLPPSPKVLQQPPITPVPSTGRPPPVVTLEECDRGWVKASGMSKIEFRRLCTLKRKASQK